MRVALLQADVESFSFSGDRVDGGGGGGYTAKRGRMCISLIRNT